MDIDQKLTTVTSCCDGSAIHIIAWCPECDCERQFLMIGIYCGECCECGEFIEVETEY